MSVKKIKLDPIQPENSNNNTKHNDVISTNHSNYIPDHNSIPNHNSNTNAKPGMKRKHEDNNDDYSFYQGNYC